MIGSEQKPKSFWKRPEGVTGIVFIIGIAIVILIFGSSIGAFILAAFQTLLHTILLFVAIGVIIYVLLDKRARNLVWYMYKSVMRWLTGVFVQIDPISILKSYVDYLYKNLSEMDTHIAKLRGQMQNLKTIIKKNEEEMESSLKIAEQAKKKGNMELVAINTRQFGRLRDANAKYEALLKKLELLYKVLSKIHKNSGYLIKDIENEVRIRKQEREAIRTGHSAMRRAMNIISGDPDKKQMFDMAMEAIIDDVSFKIGEMERFIEISGSFIDSVDLQNAVYEQEGLDILSKMEESGMSFLLGDPPQDLYSKSNDKDEDIEIEEPRSFSEYSDLFN